MPHFYAHEPVPWLTENTGLVHKPCLSAKTITLLSLFLWSG